MGTNEVKDQPEQTLAGFLKSINLGMHEAAIKAVDDELDDELILLLAKEVPVMLILAKMELIVEKLGDIEMAIDTLSQGVALST